MTSQCTLCYYLAVQGAEPFKTRDCGECGVEGRCPPSTTNTEHEITHRIIGASAVHSQNDTLSAFDRQVSSLGVSRLLVDLVCFPLDVQGQRSNARRTSVKHSMTNI